LKLFVQLRRRHRGIIRIERIDRIVDRGGNDEVVDSLPGMSTFVMISGWAYIWSSTAREYNKPNWFVLTFVTLRLVSWRFAPVCARLLCWVRTATSARTVEK